MPSDAYDAYDAGAYDAIKAGPIRIKGGQSNGTSKKRAKSHSSDDWPASRLTGKHRLGYHESGVNRCDLPGCNLRRAPTQAKQPKSGPGSRGGKAGQSSGRVSPIPMEQEGKAGNTKLFCQDCFDLDGVRPMNFHPQCWNKWHYECFDSDE